MYTAKQKQTHGYRKQTSSYQWVEGREEGQNRGTQLRDIMYKIDKQQGYIVQHREL